jgi:hypothetical protein
LVWPPNLPIDILFAEREMIAFSAADHAAAEILDVDRFADFRTILFMWNLPPSLLR